MCKFGILIFLVLSASSSLATVFDGVSANIIEEASNLGAEFSISIKHLETDEMVSPNGHKRLPMASVYKFPIAVALLKQVEKGKALLDKKVLITKDDIRGGYKGPIAKNHPEGGVEFDLRKLMEFMVSNSDNSATDLVLKELGGPRKVTKILRAMGLKEISVDRFEESLIKNGNINGELDTSSADELVKLLARFHSGKILSSSNTAMLKKLMSNATTPGHIARGLPKGIEQFHKSGWCSGSKCINDVALVKLPDDKGHLAIAILFSGDIKDTRSVSETIGKIARIAFDEALKR